MCARRQQPTDLSQRCITEVEILNLANRTDDGFVYYDELTPDQVQELANAVNALSEPLSKLTAVVVS